MKRNVSNHSYRDEKLRSSRSEDDETDLRSTEEERLPRRREKWIIEQQMLRKHESLKEKKIVEHEMRRAPEKGLPLPKGRFLHHSSNKSKSKSPESQHRNVATSSTSDTSILSKKGGSREYKENVKPHSQLHTAEEKHLRERESHRNNSREGEQRARTKDSHDSRGGNREYEEEVRPHSQLHTAEEKHLRKRKGHRDNSHSTEGEHRAWAKDFHDRGGSREYEEKVRPHSQLHTAEEKHLRKRKSHRDNSHSREGEHRAWAKDSHDSRGGSRVYEEEVSPHSQLHTAEEKHLRKRKSHRDNSYSRKGEQRSWAKYSHDGNKSSIHERPYRERSRERFWERRERDNFGERTLPPSHYIEPIPVPVYYGGFPPRPRMVEHLVPPPRQVPPFGGIRHMMRPPPPRFIQPDIYRFRQFPNPNMYFFNS